jgi:phosphoribosylformylglycinamidine cyclo-ligase
MERTFNMGIGMILVVRPHEAGEVMAALQRQGEAVHEIGEIVAGEGRVEMLGDAA